MSSNRDFEALLNETEIMVQFKQSMKDEPVKLLLDICKKFEKAKQPVPEYNLHIQGYVGDISLKALVQSGLVDYIIPDEEPWYAVLSSLERSVNRPMVHAVVNVYRTATPVVEEPAETGIPSIYALDPPYPNPFNREVAIGFSVPVYCLVTLRIYNLLGQEVVTLVDGELDAGHYEARWDGKSDRGKLVISGVYVVGMDAGDTRYSRKLCYMK